jgi:hypothetical protein
MLLYSFMEKNNIIDEDWNILTSFFPEGWEKKAYATKAFIRKRNIPNPEILLRVLLIHLANGSSLRTTAAYAAEANLCQVNDVALLKRLRASGEWLRWMAEKLRNQFVSPDFLISLPNKPRIRLIDASMISEPGSTGSDWRIHYSFDLENLRCDDFKVTDCKIGEGFTNFTARDQDLLIANRAYCHMKGISHIVGQSADVLVRYHSTALPLFNYRGKRINLLEKLRTLKETMIGDWDVFISRDTGERIKGRICAIRKSKEAIVKDRKSILKVASKKQRQVKPETLEYAEYIILFTTLNRHRLKKEAAMLLYRARWQIEISFKRLKGIMDLGHLPKTDPDSCKAWLYGKMFVALLVERLFQEAETFSPWGFPLGVHQKG